MYLSAWIFFFVTLVGFTNALLGMEARRIIEYENEICEPYKRHLDMNGCASCICRGHGYGSICELPRCAHRNRRPTGLRECTPYGEFTTRCHFCKCSPSGIPTGCMEKRARCMEEIADELDDEKFSGSPRFVESSDDELTY